MNEKLKQINEDHGTTAGLNYMSAMFGLMCLRDYEYWDDEPCPCSECK